MAAHRPTTPTIVPAISELVTKRDLIAALDTHTLRVAVMLVIAFSAVFGALITIIKLV